MKKIIYFLTATSLILGLQEKGQSKELAVHCSLGGNSTFIADHIKQDRAIRNVYGQNEINGAATNDSNYPRASLFYSHTQRPQLVIRAISSLIGTSYYDVNVALCTSFDPRTGAATLQGEAYIPGGGDAGPTLGSCRTSEIEAFNMAFGIYCGPWTKKDKDLLVPFQKYNERQEKTFVIHEEGAKFLQLHFEFLATDWNSSITVESPSGEQFLSIGPNNQIYPGISEYLHGDTLVIKAKGTGFGFNLDKIFVAK